MFGGLDLSESRDLTALVLGHVDPNDGVWHVRPFFWLPADRLAEKAARDHAPYDLWASQGHLETTPGAAIGYEFVAERLKEIFEDYQVTKIAFDLWNWAHLRPWLAKAGFSEQTLDKTFAPVWPRLQKHVAGGARSRKLWFWSGNSAMAIIRFSLCALLIRSSSAATLEIEKLSKKRSTGRIDGAVALMMAIGAAPTAWTAKFDAAALIG